MKILVIASEAPPIRSGIARSVKRLAEGLVARGHQVDIVGHPEIPRLVFGEVRLSGLAFRLPHLHSRIDAYDIVHVHGAVPTFSDVFLASVRARRGSRPLMVYTHHCDIAVGPLDWLNRVYNASHHRLAAAATDAVVSTTVGYAIGDASWVIPLGVDPEQFASTARKDPGFTVLFVGQFRPYKGARVLIRAMSKVPGARLLLAGHGPEGAEYEVLARSLGVELEVFVNLDDAQLRDLYRRAHVIALPSISRAEAFGLVLLEGMSAGCVPVASDLTGVREVLGRIGFAIEPGNVDELADCLRRLRDDPDLTREVGQRARVRARSFSWERTIDGYERLFQSLLLGQDLDAAARHQSRPAGVLRKLVDATQVIMRAQAAYVWLDGRTQGGLRLACSVTDNGQSLPPGSPLEALADYVYASGERALVTADECPVGLSRAFATWPGSAVAVPLKTEGQRMPFGVLLASRHQAFEPRDRDGLRMLGQHAAKAIRHIHQQPLGALTMVEAR